MRWPWLLAALGPAALSACTAAPPEPAAAPVAIAAPPAPAPAPSRALAEADLYGHWQIVSLNGRPPIGAEGERSPRIVFGPGSYGGSGGCNSFGGYGLFDGTRFYASGVMMTAMACRDYEAQENAVVRLMTGSPLIARGADGALTITGGGAAMVLRRTPGVLTTVDVRPPEVLAGTEWTIETFDGAGLAPHDRPVLRFEADRWSLRSRCFRIDGRWRQTGDRIEARPDPIAGQTCPPAPLRIDRSLPALLASSPRFVTGPNGEILIGGGGHWATGQRPRMALADDAPLLAGDWRIVAIDGAAPAREPSIAFGPLGFAGGTGCNSMQGHYLAHGRRFLAPPPIRTEIGCAEPLRSQEERIAGLLAGAPRIALAGEGEIALVDHRGSLRLRRAGAAPAGLPGGRIWTGTPLRAELILSGPVPLQAHYSEPATHIRFSPRRWDIDSGCARFGGVWRREEAGAVGLFTDPEPDPGAGCSRLFDTRIEELKRFFNGRARILVGESGELLIAGEEQWLAGRVLGAAAGRR
jgi:heat shock protein HslJ